MSRAHTPSPATAARPASHGVIGTRQLVARIWHQLTKRRRRQLGYISFLLLVGLAFEIATLASVVPVVSVMADPTAAMDLRILQPLIRLFEVTDSHALRKPIAGVFVAFVLLSSGVRLLYLFFSMKLAFAIGSDFAAKAFRHTLNLPYAQQSQLSSSFFLAGMQKIVEIVTKGLVPILTAFGALILALSISTTLFLVEPAVTLILGLCVGAVLMVILISFRGPLNRQGSAIALLQTEFMEKLQIARSGIREIILDDTQDRFAQDLSRTERHLRHHQVNNGFLVSAPRYFMEAIFILVLIGLAYWLFEGEAGTTHVLPTLSLVAIGALKILPAAQLIAVNWATLRGAAPSMLDAFSLFESDETDTIARAPLPPVPFKNDIVLKDVWFRYSDDAPWILQGVDLRVSRGETIGVIGQTGAGKSTLIDLMMGLLPPTKGEMLIDGAPLSQTTRRAWGKRIAHVPQSIFLTDASVAENIGFGVDVHDIDPDRIVKVAQAADIEQFVSDGQAGFATPVGERGNRISGGQRQRIGIARALYKEADVIVLDEATSALDGATEARIMKTIHAIGGAPTVLMIAHRLTTLKSCDRIIDLENGRIARTSTYDDIQGR